MKTTEYYERNAQAFASATLNVDVSELQTAFLQFIPQGGHILDAGCGSGRDSLAFLKNGFSVTAFDASESMAKVASETIKQQVLCQTFQELTYQEQFDGIWACASLLHVPKKELADVFGKLANSLKSQGVLYVSFKYGTGERLDENGRYFLDMNESALTSHINMQNSLEIITIWVTEDKRPERINERWINGLIRKKALSSN